MTTPQPFKKLFLKLLLTIAHALMETKNRCTERSHQEVYTRSCSYTNQIAAFELAARIKVGARPRQSLYQSSKCIPVGHSLLRCGWKDKLKSHRLRLRGFRGNFNGRAILIMRPSCQPLPNFLRTGVGRTSKILEGASGSAPGSSFVLFRASPGLAPIRHGLCRLGLAQLVSARFDPACPCSSLPGSARTAQSPCESFFQGLSFARIR